MIYTAIELKTFLENRKAKIKILPEGFKYKKCIRSNTDKYEIENSEEIEDGVYYAKIRLNNVYLRLYYGEHSANYHPNVIGKITADRDDCFDKMTRCPLIVKFPINEEKLFEYLEFLTTKEGRDYSNSYDYIYEVNRKIPYDDD